DQSNALILRNHGLLSCGPTVAKAFSTLWTLERACQIQLAAHSMNKAVLSLPEKAFHRTTDLDSQRDYHPEQMVLDWLRREIDKRDPSYAT
ncbi:MAG TPA: class II aldolase/adducin family protein, partial [Marine Group III euryarchaeote]|nr:class II aldolase/adducin family protein [Marine Group III euryarchaeote]